MAEEEWQKPHREAVAELGPILHVERMPWRRQVLLIPVGLGGFLTFVMIMALLFPDKPATPEAEARAAREKVLFAVLASIFLPACFIGGIVAYRYQWHGTFSIHHRGVLLLSRGERHTLLYEDVASMDVRVWQGVSADLRSLHDSRARVRIYSYHRWPPDQHGDNWSPVLFVANVVSRAIAPRLETELASGTRFRITGEISLVADGAAVWIDGKEVLVPWSELDAPHVSDLFVRLFRKNGLEPLAEWLISAPNCLPLMQLIARKTSRIG